MPKLKDRLRRTDTGSLTLSDGVPAGDAVLLGMSPTDSFQSGGFRDVLPLLRVGHPASFASKIEKIRIRINVTFHKISLLIRAAIILCISQYILVLN